MSKRKASCPEDSTNKLELNACKTIIKELFDKKYENIAWVFYDPIDPILLDLPDYNMIVTSPMDLSTVKDKLKRGVYAKHEEFAKDVRQIFHNTYLYTVANHVCHTMARQLEIVFEALYKTYVIEKTVPQAIAASASSNLAVQETNVDNIAEDIIKNLSWLPDVEINRRITSREQLALDNMVQQLDPKVLPNVIKIISYLEGTKAKYTIEDNKIVTRKLKTQTKRYIMAYISSIMSVEKES